MTGNHHSEGRLSRRGLSRRKLLSLAAAAAGVGTLSGCGYRPGGGDVRWEDSTGTGLYRPDDLLATGSTVFTVSRSVRGFDFETEEWGESAEVAAYDADSGGPRWEKKTPPSGQPAASGGRLFVGHEDDGLVALDSGGAVQWEADFDHFPRTVTAGGERVYVLTEAGDLHAFAADDGERLWRTAIGAGDRKAGDETAGNEGTGTETTGDRAMADHAALAAARNGVVVHYRGGTNANPTATEVAAIRGDGERRWTVELQSDLGGRPVTDSETGIVYVPADRTLFALSLEDGSERWSQGVTGVRDSLAIGDGRLYYVAGRTLYARNARDGDLLWQSEPKGRRGVASPPAVADGKVYVGSHDAVYALAASDRTVDWQVESGSVSGAPQIAGETVVVSTLEGYVRGHYRG